MRRLSKFAAVLSTLMIFNTSLSWGQKPPPPIVPNPQAPVLGMTVPLGVADVKRAGRDATVVAYAQGVHLALQAARQLARDEVEVEVIDVRTLKPLDLETIAESVRRTGRLVVVSEGARAGGFASEVVARVVDEAWDALRTAPVRVTAKDTPIPYAAALEREVLPQVEDVLAGIKEVLEEVHA